MPPPSESVTSNNENGKATATAVKATATAVKAPANFATPVKDPKDEIPDGPKEDSSKLQLRRRRRRRIWSVLALLVIVLVAVISVTVTVSNSARRNSNHAATTQPPTTPPPTPVPALPPTQAAATTNPPSHDPSLVPSQLPSLEKVISATTSRPTQPAAPTTNPPSYHPSLVPSQLPSSAPSEDFCRLCADGSYPPRPDGMMGSLTCAQVHELQYTRTDKLAVGNRVCKALQEDGYFNCFCPTLPIGSCRWCGQNPQTGQEIHPVELSQQVADPRGATTTCNDAYVSGLIYNEGTAQCTAHKEHYTRRCLCNETEEEAVMRRFYEASSNDNDVFDVTTVRGMAANWTRTHGRYNSTEPEKLVQLYVLALLSFQHEIDSVSSSGEYRTERNECEWVGVQCNSKGFVIGFQQDGSSGSGIFRAFAPLPREIGKLSKLVTLSISNQGRLTSSIPTQIGELRKLRVLRLSRNNRLTGSIPWTVFHYLTNLRTLDLSANNLDSVQIPEEVGNLVQLTTINLGSNSGKSMGGQLPFAIGKLKNLEALTMDGSQVGGTLPSSMQNMTSLRILSISEASISGAIPTWLGLISNLEQVSLASNILTGSLPPSLGNLANLALLFLNENELTGTIPSELGNLTSLKRLRLEGNDLSGSIPNELCALVDQRLEIFVDEVLQCDCDCTIPK